MTPARHSSADLRAGPALGVALDWTGLDVGADPHGRLLRGGGETVAGSEDGPDIVDDATCLDVGAGLHGLSLVWGGVRPGWSLCRRGVHPPCQRPVRNCWPSPVSCLDLRRPTRVRHMSQDMSHAIAVAFGRRAV